MNGFKNNIYKAYTEKDGGRVRAEEDYMRYAESNQLPGTQLRTPPIKQNAKKKERPRPWQTEPNARSKARCTDHNSVPSEGSASQIITSGHPTPFNLRKMQTALVSRETLREQGYVTNWQDGFHIYTYPNQNNPGSSDSAGSELDDVFKQNTNANIADVHDYNADVIALPDDDCKGVLVEEQNTGSTHFDLYYPIIDALSEDIGKAHAETHMFHEKGPSEEHMASDKDSESCTDYGDFPENIGTQNDRNTAPRTEPELCDEQLELVDLILEGRNVFYTGSAGCGKSTVLKYSVARLKGRGSNVCIIAPTGKAALEVGGVTLYSYAGWTPDILKKPMDKLEQNAHKTRNWKRIKHTDVLIIDEVSMVENHILERLNRVMKSARAETKKPFGGVQIVVTGDFCQLPPVRPFRFCMECGTELRRHSGGKLYECEKHGEFDDSEKWAFCSDAWKECDFVHFRLKKAHRQKEPSFTTLLEKCRLGRPLHQDEKYLLLNHECETTGAVKLFPTRDEVGQVNDAEMARLKGRSLKFKCLDNFWNCEHVAFEWKPEHGSYSHTLLALEEHRFEPILEIKENMLVILLINLDFDAGLINGSQGVIIGFETHTNDSLPEQYGEYKARKKGLIREFVKRAATTAVCEWPIVQFQNGEKRTIYAHCMMSELGDNEPYSLLSRTQVPLVAAWAMTIHKSQGMTLSRVIVDLSRTFGKAQDYVALSRARSLEGLKVEALSEHSWGCNKEILQFLEEHGWLD